MPDPFIIEEDIQSDAQRVILDGPDLPHAAPRDSAGFNSGGPVEHSKIHLGDNVIIQVKQARQRDRVFHGAFRDHLYATETGSPSQDHARSMRDAIEVIRGRANPLRVSWGTESFTGILAETNFGEESEHDITYELTFSVVHVTGTTGSSSQSKAFRDTSVDAQALAQKLNADLAQRRAEMAAVGATAQAEIALAAVSDALTAAVASLNAIAPGPGA